MKAASLFQILAYYDGPQLIEARDKIGGHYIGLAIQDADHEFLLVGTSPERLRQFRGGAIDLLDLIEERPPDVGWQRASLDGGNLTQLNLSDLSWEPIPPAFLPDRGFILRASLSVPDLVKEARVRNGLVMEVTLDPPEAVDHRINSETLGQFLLVFQRMLKHAFRAWAREQPTGQFSPNAYTFSMSGFKPGSVRIQLEPKEASNLFGAGESKPAVETVVRMIASAMDPERAVQEVIRNRGHLASAFVNLLDVLIENNTRLQIDWADGLSDTVSSTHLSHDQAQVTKTRLGQVSELEGETRVVRGVLKKADVNRGTWRLQTNDESISGQSLEDGPSLSHVEMDAAYTFTCMERIELSPSGRERSVLYLTKITS